MFKIDGEPANEKITEGQLNIFWALVFRPRNRVQIESCTQYGKSQTVALACVIISCVQDEIVAVVAPTGEKAKEIMRYFIEHLGDSPIFYSQLESNTRLERLRQEESKTRIIMREGGGIYCLSVNQRAFSRSIESAMGKGSKIVIMDEGGLISDPTESTVFRMIAGKGEKGFYCKIGNTFYTEPPYSHFYKTSKEYPKIWIDYKRALKEGRYTEEFIREARTKPMFRELYGCLFPPRDAKDAEGYEYLINDELLEASFVNELPEKMDGDKMLGADIGRGGDESAYVLRQGDYMWLDSTNKTKDTMVQVAEIKRHDREGMYHANIDDTGVGGGVVDRCIEEGLSVRGISWGSRPEVDAKTFKNLKAENYWDFKEWLENGGKILRDESWYELLQIKFKVDSTEKIQIEPKERMALRGVKSPNVADAGALTFNRVKKPEITFL